jgi:hypothetical protein
MDLILVLPFAVLMYAAIPVYAVWQVLVLFRRRGRGLVLSLLPVLPMGFVLAATVQAYLQDSTLWPLMLILTAPPAVLWLWLVGHLFPAR